MRAHYGYMCLFVAMADMSKWGKMHGRHICTKVGNQIESMVARGWGLLILSGGIKKLVVTMLLATLSLKALSCVVGLMSTVESITIESWLWYGPTT